MTESESDAYCIFSVDECSFIKQISEISHLLIEDFEKIVSFMKTFNL